MGSGGWTKPWVCLCFQRGNGSFLRNSIFGAAGGRGDVCGRHVRFLVRLCTVGWENGVLGWWILGGKFFWYIGIRDIFGACDRVLVAFDFLCGMERAGIGFWWVIAGADLGFEGDLKPIEASWGGFWGGSGR